jgi:DNA processing protein
MADSYEQLLLWIALGRVRNLGPVLIKRLLRVFDTPQAIFGASHSRLVKVKGISSNIADSIARGPDLGFARQQMDVALSRDFRLITCKSAGYPQRLSQIYDPPYLLYVKGNLNESDGRAVAMVGSRHATHYGRSVAEDIAMQLARAGVTVVSGFARGIDSISHRAAVLSGGRTIAVLGCGIDVIYPPENVSLYRDISEHGALISEFPFGTAPEGPNFPRRNRIISGLSLGVVIVEAGAKSGALLTANHALEQNREVFAVPGNITSVTSFGTNSLIKQGARPVTSAEDVLSELEFVLPSADEDRPSRVAAVRLDHEQTRLFEMIGDEPVHVDMLSRRSGLEVSRLLEVLLAMELKGAIMQVPGKRFVKSDTRPYNGKSA